MTSLTTVEVNCTAFQTHQTTELDRPGRCSSACLGPSVGLSQEEQPSSRLKPPPRKEGRKGRRGEEKERKAGKRKGVPIKTG